MIPVVLVAGWTIADRLQPPAFSSFRQSVSVAAGYGGRYRWVMTGALLAVGVLYLVVAAGVAGMRAGARIGLLVAGGAAIGIALCPEPVLGSTTQHQVFTGIGELAIAIWPVLAVPRPLPVPAAVQRRAWAAATLLGVGLLGWLIAEIATDGELLGLAERVGVRPR